MISKKQWIICRETAVRQLCQAASIASERFERLSTSSQLRSGLPPTNTLIVDVWWQPIVSGPAKPGDYYYEQLKFFRRCEHMGVKFIWLDPYDLSHLDIERVRAALGMEPLDEMIARYLAYLEGGGTTLESQLGEVRLAWKKLWYALVSVTIEALRRPFAKP